jgi:hypothetical protein
MKRALVTPLDEGLFLPGASMSRDQAVSLASEHEPSGPQTRVPSNPLEPAGARVGRTDPIHASMSRGLTGASKRSRTSVQGSQFL